MPYVKKSHKIYLKKNTYSIDNSYGFSNPHIGTFYSVENYYSDFQKNDTSYIFNSAEFWLDSKTTHYEVSVYSFLDVVSTIGGIYEIVTVLLYLLFNYISNKIFQYYSIINLSKTENDVRQIVKTNYLHKQQVQKTEEIKQIAKAKRVESKRSTTNRLQSIVDFVDNQIKDAKIDWQDLKQHKEVYFSSNTQIYN